MSSALEKLTPIYKKNRKTFFPGVFRLLENIKKYKMLYLFLVPGLLYFIIFHYIPMGGLIIAFKDYKMSEGFLMSPWVGFKHFTKLFSTDKFYQVLFNTLIINFYKTLLFFPVPIIISLLLNEIRYIHFKRTIQSILYFPHFLSWVIVAGFVFQFLGPLGPVNNVLGSLFGIGPISFMAKSKYFRSILVLTAVWRGTGWSTILYMAQLSTINPQLYEAAYVDGASRYKQMIYISLPGILPIVAITLIIRLGQTMTIGFEQVLVLYNPLVYNVGDVIQTYIYRVGLQNARFSFSTACGVFQAVIAFILLWTCNRLVKKMSGQGIW